MKRLFLLFLFPLIPALLLGQDVTRNWSDTDLTVRNVTVNGIISGFAELEFDTVAQMKAYDFSQVTDGARVKCNGYWVSNDQAFGPDVFWNSTSTATDNGLLVFDPAAAGAGRLIRSFDSPINVKWAGARGAGEARTGTITSTGTAVVGVGTLFTTELTINDYIRTENANGGYVAKVSAITDDTNLTLSTAFPANVSGESFTEIYDSQSAIQVAVDQGQSVSLPTGVFHVTDEIALVHGSKLRGEGNYSGVASTFETQGTSIIKYIGAGGSNSCVVRVSDEVVGTEPLDASSRDMQNTGVSYLTIDGNGLAEIGLYMIRAVSNNNYEFITVTRTKEHGFYVAVSWNGVATNWMAYKNEKAGITIADNIWSPAWANTTVDQTSFISLFGYFNGYDDITDTWTSNFADANPDRDYGIGYWGGRGNVFINAQGSQNGGAGLYLSPEFRPTTFTGGYVENNGKSDNISYYTLVSDGAITASDATLTSASNPFTASMVGFRIKVAGAGAASADLITTILSYTNAGEVELATTASTTVSGATVSRPNDWDIWFEGAAGGVSWDTTFDGMHQGGLGRIKLSGTEPSRVENGVLFRRMGQLNAINADWGNYRYEDSNRSITIVGTSPSFFSRSVNGARSLTPAGLCYFDATSGSIGGVWYEGLISSVVYTAVGTYTVTFSETLSSSGYVAHATTGNNRIVAIDGRSTTGFVVYNRSNAGTLLDSNARISLSVHGRY